MEQQPSTTDPDQTEDFRDAYGFRFFYRKASVDECVLSIEYQRSRFFAPGYQAKPTDTIPDVGAHIGVFTALAAKKVPRGKVHAIEGESANFDLLLKNVAANGLSNVEAHKLVLGRTTGPVKLYRGTDTWEHSIQAPPGHLEDVN